MRDIKVIEGGLTAKDLRVGIVASRFNELIVESLVSGAVDALVRHGVHERDITLVRVPGAWEMPIAVRRMAERRRFDVIIALGAVIRGGTPHFEYVAGECAKGIAQASQAADVVPSRRSGRPTLPTKSVSPVKRATGSGCVSVT